LKKLAGPIIAVVLSLSLIVWVAVTNANLNKQFEQLKAKGDQLLSQQKYTEALAVLRQAQEIRTKDKNVNQAINRAERVLNSIKMFNQGMTDFNKSNYQLAMDEFQSVIPEDKEHYNTAQAKIANAKTQLALIQIKTAKELYSKGDFRGAYVALLDSNILVNPPLPEAARLLPAYKKKVEQLEERARQLAEKQRQEQEAAEKARRRSEGVRIGMTQEEVLDSSWGRPQHINTTTTKYGTHEQWVYDGRNYLYFEDGILTAIQN